MDVADAELLLLSVGLRLPAAGDIWTWEPNVPADRCVVEVEQVTWVPSQPAFYVRARTPERSFLVEWSDWIMCAVLNVPAAARPQA